MFAVVFMPILPLLSLTYTHFILTHVCRPKADEDSNNMDILNAGLDVRHILEWKGNLTVSTVWNTGKTGNIYYCFLKKLNSIRYDLGQGPSVDYSAEEVHRKKDQKVPEKEEKEEKSSPEKDNFETSKVLSLVFIISQNWVDQEMVCSTKKLVGNV